MEARATGQQLQTWGYTIEQDKQITRLSIYSSLSTRLTSSCQVKSILANHWYQHNRTLSCQKRTLPCHAHVLMLMTCQEKMTKVTLESLCFFWLEKKKNNYRNNSKSTRKLLFTICQSYPPVPIMLGRCDCTYFSQFWVRQKGASSLVKVSKPQIIVIVTVKESGLCYNTVDVVNCA